MEKATTSLFLFQIDPKHYQQHNYLTFCNDVLVSILRYAAATKLSTTKLEFNTKADFDAFEQAKKESEDWQEWLLYNGHHNELYEAYFRHTFFSLIADFCNYMLESINCAAKMKVAVSYALLRKPLKETLGYIEWLYINRNELLDLLIHGNPRDLEIKRPRAQKNTSLIEEKRGATSYYDFRYNMSSEISLEHIWNNANHLITTRCSFSKTAPGSLNFVFNDEFSLRKFSDYYYITVPAIMSYAVDLICDIFEGFAPITDYTILVNKMNRTLKALIPLDQTSSVDFKSLCKEFNFNMICPKCRGVFDVDDELLQSMANDHLVCPHCQTIIDTTQYMFDWEESDLLSAK